jgi:ABC-type transport system substrate-binding protein
MRMLARCMRALLVVLACVQGAAAADMGKVLHDSFPVPETGFDPQALSDLYSADICRVIFDPLLELDYLARPFKLRPRTAEAMPEIRDGGRIYVFKLRKGIYFTSDPVFKGARRELTAEDYVFSWKRLLDPRVRSSYLWILDGKVVGADPIVEAARKPGGKFDYDAPMEGLRALDRYTLQLTLKAPDYSLIYQMTQPYMAAVAREVIAAYGDASTWAQANPVGTGPYVLRDWRRGQRIVLEANPEFREEYYPDSADPGDKPLLDAMRGKRLPIIGRIEVNVIEESQPQLLAFNSNALDVLHVPRDLVAKVIAGDRLLPEYAQRGVQWQRGMMPALTYQYFNMEDPVVGGYTKDKIALRRAMVMGFNVDEYIRIQWQGQAIAASQPVPPNLSGHDPSYKRLARYDPSAARALLDKFGYKDRDGDGFREMPDGGPLVVERTSRADGLDRLLNELWQKNMESIGIRMRFVVRPFPEQLKLGKQGQIQMGGLGWFSPVPDGETFMMLNYGGNIGQFNYARFKLPEYDRLFELSKTTPPGPERTRYYRQMTELIGIYAPWELGVYRMETTIVQPWVKGYKKNPFIPKPWAYLDIDTNKRPTVVGRN